MKYAAQLLISVNDLSCLHLGGFSPVLGTRRILIAMVGILYHLYPPENTNSDEEMISPFAGRSLLCISTGRGLVIYM